MRLVKLCSLALFAFFAGTLHSAALTEGEKAFLSQTNPERLGKLILLQPGCFDLEPEDLNELVGHEFKRARIKPTGVVGEPLYLEVYLMCSKAPIGNSVAMDLDIRFGKWDEGILGSMDYSPAIRHIEDQESLLRIIEDSVQEAITAYISVNFQ